MRQNRIGRPLLNCNKGRKKSGRDIMETLIERRRCTRITESAQRFLRRSRHAKDCTKSFQRSPEVETNLSLQSNNSDKGAINSLKALKNTHIDLMLQQDGGTILLPQRTRLHLRHHDGNWAAICGQRGTGTHVNLHPGVNSDFSKSLQMSVFFRLLEI